MRLLAALLASSFALAPYALATEFNVCLGKLRKEASAKGVAPTTFDTALTGVEPDQTVLDALDYQPEFRTPIWDYMAGLVDEERVADGRARFAQYGPLLAEIEQRYGVDRHVLAAVWGVETNYGTVMGSRSLVRSLATLSCAGHRQRFFRGELFAALNIVQNGDIAADALKGSWAGAFGQTQFMPTTFQRLAVDFDGDGRRNVVGSVADALGSTANYLRRAGWLPGEPWGYEVSLPPNYNGPSGRRNRMPLAKWSRLGIQRVDGSALAGGGPAALLLPAGAEGPAFLVFRNFDAIYAYNAAESYSLAIAHLSDRLRGGGPFLTAWPTDDPGLSRAERREVQERLAARGYDVGKPDGIIGTRTRAAIEAFQTSLGLTPDGRAGARVLQALQAEKAPAKGDKIKVTTEGGETKVTTEGDGKP
jgi:lytic murein transglycosylase